QMYQKIETSRLLVWKAAWEADQQRDPTLNASISKLYATEAAFEVVDQALQILGGYGYTRFFPVEKLLRDTRLFRVYEGTSEVQQLIISGYVMNSYQPAMPPLEELPIHNKNDFPDVDGENPGTGVWRCKMCGYVHFGDDAPEECPYCFFPKAAFTKIDR
ncbi:MAG: acyl-CoA dehydrogenase family protein, partial [Desulfobacterales bacterium]